MFDLGTQHFQGPVPGSLVVLTHARSEEEVILSEPSSEAEAAPEEEVRTVRLPAAPAVCLHTSRLAERLMLCAGVRRCQ